MISERWKKDFAKCRRQGFQCHHFHALFAGLPLAERIEPCLLTWNEVRNILREMRDEQEDIVLGLVKPSKSSAEIMHDYGQLQTKKFLRLA